MNLLLPAVKITALCPGGRWPAALMWLSLGQAGCFLPSFETAEEGGAGGSSGTGAATGGAGGAGTGGAGGAGAGGAGGAGGSGVVSCFDQYSAAPGYVDCLETPETCEFGFDNSIQSCGAVCAELGGECIDMFNDDGGCGKTEDHDCVFVGLGAGICICTHGCGAGPPCPEGTTCLSAVCT